MSYQASKRTDCVLAACLGLLCFASTATGDEITEAVAQLICAAEVYDEMSMTKSCDFLVGQGAAATGVLSDLIEHANGVVRWKALQCLRRIGPVGTSDFKTLLQRMMATATDSDPDVRAEGVLALTAWFANSLRIRDTVDQLTMDRNAVVRANALYCQWRLCQRQTALSRLAAIVSDKDWMAAERAEEHLLSIGEPARTELHRAIDRAFAAGATTTVGQRTRLVRTLSLLGKLDPQTREYLSNLTHLDEAQIVHAAAFGLVRYGSDGLPALRRLLESDSHHNQATALRALAKLHHAAFPALQLVEKSLDSEASQVRVAAILAYPKITGATDSGLRRYSQLLKDKDADVRAAAASAVRAWNASATPLRPAIRDLVSSDPLDFVRQAAADTLSRLESFALE